MARAPLDFWYRVTRRAGWASFPEVRAAFRSADLVAPYVVFDIGGNKFRLIAEIDFSRKVLFVRSILTHREYEKGAWKA